MDFTQAISAHGLWKTRFKEAIHGSGERFDIATLERDNCCVLGQWLYGEGKAYSRLAVYGIVRQEHAAFHHAAAQVARLIEQGKTQEAEKQLEMGSAFTAHSAAIVRGLTELKKTVA